MTSSRINPAIRDRAVPIDVPVLFGKNPRRGDVDRIAKSLMENGQYKPITIRQGTNEVLVGNHTLKAARQLGWEEIAADAIEVINDDHAKAIVVVDNFSSSWGLIDSADHADLLASMDDATYGTGLTPGELEHALNDIVQEPADVPDDADDVAPAPEAPKTKPGDVWELGPHRLVCGDATDPRVLEQLLGAERPHLMWTDPPYGVDYQVNLTPEQAKKQKRRLDGAVVMNDGSVGLQELLEKAFEAAADVLRPGAPVYVAHADTERVVFEGALRKAGFLVRQNLIWVKHYMALGHSDYHYRHEPILLAGQPVFNDGDQDQDDDAVVTPLFQEPAGEDLGKDHDPILYGFAPAGAGRLGRGGPRWYGPNNGTTVFEFPKPASSVEHPTMKPVGLIVAHLTNSLRANQGRIVLDPFAGSGSTMIAAELHGASARLVELDPRYCDVIAMRWQKHTGQRPLRNGKPVAFPVKKADS